MTRDLASRQRRSRRPVARNRGCDGRGYERSSEAISADWSGELAAWAEQFDLAGWRNARCERMARVARAGQTARISMGREHGRDASRSAAWPGSAWRRAARRWPTVEVDGARVLVSERLGPAVFGLLRRASSCRAGCSRQPEQMRVIALRHEREHVAARDHALLAVALLLMALAPWNPALWWQLRRLRFAIEIDCDARVTRRGTIRSRTRTCCSLSGGGTQLLPSRLLR